MNGWGAFRVAAAVLGVAVGGCEESRQSDRALLDQRRQEIIAFALSGGCATGGECRFSPMGKKACGGPTGYIVYSSSLDTAALRRMIQEYTAEEDAYNVRWGIVSDCSIPPPPDSLRCADGVCLGYWGGTGRVWN